MTRTLFLLSALSLTACSESKIVGVVDGSLDSGDTTGDEVETDTTMWEGASLIVTTPLSGDFLALGEDAAFEATIYSADGEPMDFDDIAWRSDIDDGWSIVGADTEDDSLEVGRHAITAEAILPNGDRLASTMGGVLVQHADAGIYVGDVRVDITLDFNGTEYTDGCVGATTITVDAYGETAVGDSACVLALLGFEQELAYNFDLAVDDGELSGSTAVDLLLFELDFEIVGELGDGEMSATWESSDFVEIAGELGATRISRDVGE